MIKRYPNFIFILFIVLLSNCKKGEDDPFISFRTRKARVAGEWRMTSGKASFTGSGYNESYTFDGANMKVNVTSAAPIIYTGKATLFLKLTADGNFELSETLGSTKLNASGQWNFNTGVGEEKKKENLVFDITKVSYGYTDGNNLFNRLSSHFIYHIKELRNKKMVVYALGKIYSNTQGTYYTLSNEYILEPQN